MGSAACRRRLVAGASGGFATGGGSSARVSASSIGESSGEKLTYEHATMYAKGERERERGIEEIGSEDGGGAQLRSESLDKPSR